MQIFKVSDVKVTFREISTFVTQQQFCRTFFFQPQEPEKLLPLHLLPQNSATSKGRLLGSEGAALPYCNHRGGGRGRSSTTSLERRRHQISDRIVF